MKNQNLFIYSILAIGLISVPSLLDTVQAQVNMTNTTSASVQNQTAQTQANQTAQSANQTISKETQALMTLDIPMIKDQLMNAKTSLLNNNTEEALTDL